MFKIVNGRSHIIYNYNIAESIAAKPLQKKNYFTSTPTNFLQKSKLNNNFNGIQNNYVFDNHLLSSFTEKPSKYLKEKQKDINNLLHEIQDKRIDLLLNKAYDKTHNNIRNYSFKNSIINKNNILLKNKTNFSCDKNYFIDYNFDKNCNLNRNNKYGNNNKKIIFLENDLNIDKNENINGKGLTTVTKDKIKNNILNTVNHFFPKRYYNVKTSNKRIQEKIKKINFENKKKEKIFNDYKKLYSIKYIKLGSKEKNYYSKNDKIDTNNNNLNFYDKEKIEKNEKSDKINEKNEKGDKKKNGFESVGNPAIAIYNKHSKKLPFIQEDNKNKKSDKKVDVGLNTMSNFLSDQFVINKGFDYYTKL